MPLGHRAFSPYQPGISKLCESKHPDYAKDDNDDSKMCFLFDHLVDVWEKLKYIDIYADTMASKGVVCRKVIDNEGKVKGLKLLCLSH